MKNNNKVLRLLFSLFICVCLVFTYTNVNAYSLNTDGYYSSTVQINTTLSVYAAYSSEVDAAISNWNNAGIPCSIVSGSAPYNNCLVTTTQYTATFYGAYAVYAQDKNSYPAHTTTRFEILLNRNMLDTMTSATKQSTACHEFGHAFGLSDLTSGTAIMNNNRNRGTLYTAQSDDISGVNDSW